MRYIDKVQKWLVAKFGEIQNFYLPGDDIK